MEDKSKAFTLIEMIIVMVVIGIMATIIVPKLKFRKGETDWPSIIGEFNNFVHFARQEAIANQRVYRILFQTNKNEPDFILIQKEGVDPENSEKRIYKQAESDYFKTKYDLPQGIKMEEFYLANTEQFSQNKNRAYCYIIPNGLVQDVMIHLTRDIDGKKSKATFKMEPFLANFIFYQDFLKPEK